MASDTAISSAQLGQLVRSGALTANEAQQLYQMGGVLPQMPAAVPAYAATTGFSDGGANQAFDNPAFSQAVQQARASSDGYANTVTYAAPPAAGTHVPPLPTPLQALEALKAGDNIATLTGLKEKDESDPILNFQSNLMLHALAARSQFRVELGPAALMQRYRDDMAKAHANAGGAKEWKAATTWKERQAERLSFVKGGAGDAATAVRQQTDYKAYKAWAESNRLPSGKLPNAQAYLDANPHVNQALRGSYDDVLGATFIRGTVLARYLATAWQATRNLGSRILNIATFGRYGGVSTGRHAADSAARTAGTATAKGSGAAAAKGGAKLLGRCVPGLGFAVTALDFAECGRICTDDKASGMKKGAAVITAGLSAVASACSATGVGVPVAAVASVAATVTGFLRDLF
jgi:hypothetical protein